MSKLIFDENKYQVKTIELDGESVTYRGFEQILYVENPVDVPHQSMNIFVPECYYEGKEINGYHLKNAPIFFPNTVGGYRPGMPDEPGRDFIGRVNATFRALQHGYVVACPGTRGIGMENEKGYIGIAPAHMTDLKAAVRYLKYNRDRIPGDADKIISNGTSAGGAISSILGATGNHPDYEKYLAEVGAAHGEDDIFAASCYCPITNLDHADMAYEWEFCGLNDYHRMRFLPPLPGEKMPQLIPVDDVMTEKQQEMSKQLKPMFPPYLNSLELKAGETDLTLDSQGNGSFKEYICSYVMKSVQKELDQGHDLSEYTWFATEDGVVTSIDWDAYIKFRTRMKEAPAFDNTAMGTPENELFGNKTTKFRHFTEFSMNHSEVDGVMAEADQIKLMNPMYYIRDEKATKAKHYRIRHGAVDRDTSLAISAMLTAMLRMEGVEVDYHLPWGIPHSGDYDLPELFAWIDAICK